MHRNLLYILKTVRSQESTLHSQDSQQSTNWNASGAENVSILTDLEEKWCFQITILSLDLKTNQYLQ